MITIRGLLKKIGLGTTAYPVLSESDSESEEELMRVEENVEELVDDEETLAMLRNLRKACAEKEANAAKQGGCVFSFY